METPGKYNAQSRFATCRKTYRLLTVVAIANVKLFLLEGCVLSKYEYLSGLQPTYISYAIYEMMVEVWLTICVENLTWTKSKDSNIN